MMSGALIDAGTHRRLLDAWRPEGQAAKVEALWTARQEAQAAAEAHKSEVERANAKAIGCVTRSMSSTSSRRKLAKRPRLPSGAPP